jgi:hypothetical protein
MKFLAILVTMALGAPALASVDSTPRTLCDALATVGNGDRLSVEISGIYAVGFEAAVFYDPNENPCRVDVQPQTWVEFASDCPSHPELSRIIEKSHRAYVKFKGELIGPPAVRADDPSISDEQVAKLVRIGGTRRYGHLNGWRTEFIVHGISDVRQVPESVTWGAPAHHQEPAGEAVLPTVPALPKYPELARNAGVTGDVDLDVTVHEGIPAVKVVSGDRMLASEAVATLKAWRFRREFESTFRIRISYRLEQRLTGADPNPRVEFHLPSQVTITAPQNGW